MKRVAISALPKKKKKKKKHSAKSANAKSDKRIEVKIGRTIIFVMFNT